MDITYNIKLIKEIFSSLRLPQLVFPHTKIEIKDFKENWEEHFEYIKMCSLKDLKNDIKLKSFLFGKEKILTITIDNKNYLSFTFSSSNRKNDLKINEIFEILSLESLFFFQNCFETYKICFECWKSAKKNYNWKLAEHYMNYMSEIVKILDCSYYFQKK